MKRNLLALLLLSVFFFVSVQLFQCSRDNPFDIYSDSFVSGKKPHVHFTDTLISGYLLDTVVISVAWSDTATGGIPGIIKTCYIDWDGDGNFSDSITDIPIDSLIIKKVFYPQKNWVKIMLIDSEGDTSNIDSVFLEIKTSTPHITSLEAPDTALKGIPFTIIGTAADTGGVITSWLWAVNESSFSKTTDTGSLTLTLDSVGQNTIQVKTRDNKMVESAKRIITIHVIDLSDSVGPQITFLSPLEADTVRSRQWVVSAQILDQSGVGGVTLNDSVTMQMVGSTYRGTIFLKDGENTLTISAVDSKGLRTEKQIKIVVMVPDVDLLPPVVRLLAPVKWSDTVSNSSLSVRMFVNDESGVVSVLFDGELLLPDSGDGSYAAERELQDGVNRFVVRSVDKKGNAQIDTLTVFWDKEAIDSIPPALTILEPTFMKHIFDSVAVVTGTVTDAGKIRSVTVNDIEAYLDYPFWSATVRLTKGINLFTVIATDNSVNRNSTEKQVSVISNKFPKFTSSPRDTFVYLGRNLTFSATVTDDDTGVGYSITRSQITYGTVTPFVSDSSGVTFTYTAGSPGTDTFKLVARDIWGDIASAQWYVTALALSDSAPRFTNGKLPDTAFVSDTLRTAVHASDPNGLPLTYSFKGQKPSGMTINSENGAIIWIPTNADTGKPEITINASNGLQESIYLWKPIVLPKNRPPQFLPMTDLAVDENQRLLVIINATDPNNDRLDFSFGGTFPDGAKLDSNKFSWTPTFADSGKHTVIFIVKESRRNPPLSDTQTVTITVNNVNQKPVFVNPGLITGVMNQLLIFTLSATDPDKDSVTYSMKNAPGGATLTRNLFRWTPATADTGTRTVRFFASDSRLSDSIDVSIKINKENRPPVFNEPGDTSINENQLLQFTLSAIDPDNDSLVYTMTDVANTGAQLQGKNFSWRPTYNQHGTYSMTFTACDNVSPSKCNSVTVTIIVRNVNAPPVLVSPGNRSVNENEELKFSLYATDPDGNTLRYFTPEALPTGALLNGNNFTWTPQFDQYGSYPVTFIVEDNGNPRLQDKQSITITVRNVNQPPVVIDTSLTVNEDSQISFQIRASDPDGVTPSLKFISPDLPLNAGITPNGQFNWLPSFTQAGYYPITVIVQDTSNRVSILSDTAIIRINVNNVNRKPSFTDKSPKSGTELSPISFQLQATDPDNDPLIFSAENLPGNSVLNNGVFFWTPADTDAGTYNVRFSVRDTIAGTVSLRDTATITITIANVFPSVPVLVSPESNVSGQPTTITFKWNKATAATGYHFQIADNEDFDSTIANDSFLTDTVKTVSGLTNGTTYYWRVRALNPGAESDWSDPVRRLTVVNGYSLVITAENGNVVKSPNLDSYDAGTVVTLTAQPAQGYQFTGWSGDLSGSTNPIAITMDAAKNITANFELKTYSLELLHSSGGNITEPSGPIYPARHGIPVSLVATPDDASRFVRWTVLSGNAVFNNESSPTTLVTLTSDAAIQANFATKTYQLTVNARTGGTITEPTSPITVDHGVATTITASVSNGYTFAHWTVASGAGNAVFADSTNDTTVVTLSGDATVLACYTYTLTLATNGAGGAVLPVSPYLTEYDVPVSLVAQPNAGYSFSHWTVVNGTATIENLEASSTTVRLRDNALVRANFTNGIFTLTVSAGENGRITAPSPATLLTRYEEVIPATAVAETGYHFENWSILSGNPEIANLTSSSTNITVRGNAEVRANFTINSYTLNVSSGDGGTITEPASGSLSATHGSTATVTAAALTGYHFENWSVVGEGNVQILNPNSPTTGIVVSGNASVRANFTVNTYTLNVVSTIGGTITEPSSGALSATHGSTATVTANAATGYHFENWSILGEGDVQILNQNSLISGIVVNGNATVQANFAPNIHHLSITTMEGGTIIAPAQPELDTTYGSTVMITVSVNHGYRFTGWTVVSGGATITNGGELTAEVRMADDNATIRANFEELPTFTVTVAAQSGGAIVHPDPASQPLTVYYGDTIDVVAEPLSGSAFFDWTFLSEERGSVRFVEHATSPINRAVITGDADIFANFTTPEPQE